MGASGIWNHAALATMSLASAKPQAAAATTASTSSNDSGSGISADDFLTLLVTEMQNQDPTADTDPNEYINQLVSVNSLEQLIQINQTLSAAAGAGESGGTGHLNTNSAAAVSTAERGMNGHDVGSAPAVTAGNLGTPPMNPAAERVAQALNTLKASPTARY